jgi:hypothetical protein
MPSRSAGSTLQAHCGRPQPRVSIRWRSLPLPPRGHSSARGLYETHLTRWWHELGLILKIHAGRRSRRVVPCPTSASVGG